MFLAQGTSLNLGQSFLGHSFSLCSIIFPYYLVGRKDIFWDDSFMDGLSLHWESFLATENGLFIIHMPSFKKEISARLTPIKTLGFFPIPGLLHVSEMSPTISVYSLLLSLHLILQPYCPPSSLSHLISSPLISEIYFVSFSKKYSNILPCTFLVAWLHKYMDCASIILSFMANFHILVSIYHACPFKKCLKIVPMLFFPTLFLKSSCIQKINL